MLNDVRYALRSFLRAPLFTTVVLLTLALGIGANTAIFSVIHAVLIAPLPYPAPSQLVRVARGSSTPGHERLDRADRQRFTELALGASPRDVFRLIAGGGMAVAAGGAAVGLAASAALSGVLSGMLFEIPARDGATFAAAAIVILTAAAVAAGVPAWRAARVDPLIVLRSE
jgi:hypothetical protein